MPAQEPEPRVSIVIPCYNQTDFLRECLESLVAQTFEAWEAIIVDDKSTAGNPAEVVASFAEPRFRTIVNQVNLGLGPTRNVGFRAARCDLILPLDSDDRLAPRFLEATVARLEADPRADCAYTDFQLFGAVSGISRNKIKTPADMLDRQWIPGPGTLMRRRVWEQVGGYPDMRRGNEDWEFWIRAVEHGLRPLHVPEALYFYRRGPHAMSLATAVHEYATRESMYRAHRGFFKQHSKGSLFLAHGYWRSARAFVQRKRPLRASYLFARYAALWPKRIIDWNKRRNHRASGA